MNSNLKNESTKLLVIFLVFFALMTGIFPAIIFHSVTPDSAQNIAWGHTFSWGYDEHPPLGAWLLNLFIKIFVNNEVAVFLATAFCLITALYFSYKTSKFFLTEKAALAATMLSTLVIYYFPLSSINYNQNTILLPLWIMSIYYFWRAITELNLKLWLILAIVAALAVLAKYEALVILFIEVVYLLFHFRRVYIKNVFIAFLLFSAICLPHIIWLVKTNYLTIQYFIGQTTKYNHGHFSLKNVRGTLIWLANELLNISLAILVFFFIYRQKNHAISSIKPKLFCYLNLVGFAPCLLVFFIALFSGIRLRPEWGFTFFPFTISALFYFFDVSCEKLNLKKLLIGVMVLQLFLFTLIVTVIFYSKRPTWLNAPSYELAKTGQQFWAQHENGAPMKYAGGDYFYGYFLAAYLPSHPAFLSNFSLSQSPWIDKKDFDKHGALLISHGCNVIPKELQESKLKIAHQACFTIPQSNKASKTQTATLSLFIVAPNSNSTT